MFFGDVLTDHQDITEIVDAHCEREVAKWSPKRGANG